MNHSMLLRRSAALLACLALGQGFSSCVFSVSGHHEGGHPREEAMKSGAEESERERLRAGVEEAELQLALARHGAEARVAEVRQELDDARHAWEEARLALEHFQATEKPRRMADEQLDVDEARFELDNRRLELEQLESDYERYGKEHYAQLTREIVVSRSKARLGFSERRLALSEGELAAVVEHELPLERRGLERGVAEARVALELAEGAVERAELEGTLEIHQAERALAEALRELEEGEDRDCCAGGERSDGEGED
jgi:hypothetical protein